MQINEDIFLLLSNVIRNNGWIDLPARGTSMFPFIRQGNICRFVPCEFSKLHRGDIVLYCSSDGQLVAHRLHRISQGHLKRQYVCKGDTNLGFDQPIYSHQMIGKLLYVRKKNKAVFMTRASSWLWTHTLLTLPQVSQWLNAYLKRKNAQGNPDNKSELAYEAGRTP